VDKMWKTYDFLWKTIDILTFSYFNNFERRMRMGFLTKILTFLTPATIQDDLLNGIASVMENIGQFFVNGFSALTGIFWASESGLTFVGWLVVIGIAAGIVSSLLAMVFGLLRNIRIGGRRR